MQQTVEAMSRTTLLHCERDRSHLRNVAGSASDGNDVRTWGSAGISSTSAITAPAATESNKGQKQYERSENPPPSPLSSRDANEQDARETCAAHQWPEEPGPVESGTGRRGGDSESSCFR